MLVRIRNNDQYTLEDITTGKHYKAHVKRIVPFYYDELLHDPYKIAATDLDEEVIECILDHTTTRHKNNMEFLVRWRGQDDSHNLWLPWRELHNNVQLHKYLHERELDKLIPKQFRKEEYH
jgi:hypothetical protein